MRLTGNTDTSTTVPESRSIWAAGGMYVPVSFSVAIRHGRMAIPAGKFKEGCGDTTVQTSELEV